MDAQRIIDKASDDFDVNWDDYSKLMVALRYIENQGDNPAFEEFVRVQAAEETLLTKDNGEEEHEVS